MLAAPPMSSSLWALATESAASSPAPTEQSNLHERHGKSRWSRENVQLGILDGISESFGNVTSREASCLGMNNTSGHVGEYRRFIGSEALAPEKRLGLVH